MKKEFLPLTTLTGTFGTFTNNDKMSKYKFVWFVVKIFENKVGEEYEL